MPVTRAGNTAALARDLGFAVVAPVIVFAAAVLIHSSLGITRLGILFLAAVTVVASVRGSRAAIMAALASVIAYKLFLDLRTSNQTTTIEDALNVATFLVVALITGTLAGRVRDEAAKACRHAESMELLFKTSRVLSEENEAAFWPALTDALAKGSGGASVALDKGGQVRAQAGDPDRIATAIPFGTQIIRLREDELAAAQNGWRARRIPAEEPFEGVLLWEDQKPGSGMDEFAELVAELGSASLSRSHARREQLRIEAAEEGGKLREALLSSISHDFRSPLAAIIGSATSLLEYGDKFSEEVRQDLLSNIQDEGERLNQFVSNLLNMTRLQAGVLHPSVKCVRVCNVAAAALERLTRHLGHRPNIMIDARCEILADPLLLEQAMYNVLDNACKYGAPEEGIQVTTQSHARICEIVISDHGPGLAKEDQAGVFSTFHFARKTGKTKGTGLGLSISQGFIAAMGGRIEARDRSDGLPGLEIAITLPRSLG